MDMRWDEGLDQVAATLNYLRPMNGKPVSYTFEPPDGTLWRTGEYVGQTVAVRNARPIQTLLSLDVQGFAFTQFKCAVSNFYDENEVRAVYYPEVERQLQIATGAARVIVFDHNVRNARKAAAGEVGIREPVTRVHNDFTARSGPERARAVLTARGQDATDALKGRFAMINLWRPISGPVKESPLALCDASTIASEDFVASDLVYRDRVGETYSVIFNPRHHWFYFPEMTQEEAVLIKCFDSREDGGGRFTAHTAFVDPTSPADAPPRESIEARALVLYPPDRSGLD